MTPRRRDLPSGTVTFLFTDVERSTDLLRDLGDHEYSQALAEHRRLLRKVFERHGGVEVDTQGDAFFVAFATARGALAAGQDATEALSTGPVQVRIGVHTGTPLVTDEGYVGMDVHRAARIAAAGHGGQVLVSASTAALVERELRELGEHRLKDLQAAERIYQLGEDDFPPLKSLYRTNLPVPSTPFLGREAELADVVRLLRRDDVRLLTLTGPGGTGKTRLALQAAAEAADDFPDGLWWISLAPLRDASLLLPAVAHALEVTEQPDRPLAETLTAALRGKNTLLLLDNAEHLLPAAAREIAGVASVVGPVLLVTTRERLQLQGEQLYLVPTLREREGLELFHARARALDPEFAANGAVGELCSRLDNLPLAIELAAARTPLFTPKQLVERLSQRLDLLQAGRDADPRQQTLRATIAWSYDLLDPDEQRLFRGLSVFAGGCTFEAAEEVCEARADTLQSLLDKSLVRRRERGARVCCSPKPRLDGDDRRVSPAMVEGAGPPARARTVGRATARARHHAVFARQGARGTHLGRGSAGRRRAAAGARRGAAAAGARDRFGQPALECAVRARICSVLARGRRTRPNALPRDDRDLPHRAPEARAAVSGRSRLVAAFGG